jgi:hypothetical protein
MSCEIFKVSTTTLEKLRELSEERGSSIRDILELSVVNYYDRTCVSSIKLVLTDDNEFLVKPKDEYQEKVESMLGREGPYLVTKTCKSNLGYSDGVYKIKDCDFFLPAGHFTKVEKKIDLVSGVFLVSWLLAILQSGMLLYMIQLI